MNLKHAFFAIVVTLVALTGQVYGDVIVNGEVDIPFTAFVPCAGDGNGEFIEGVSQFHFLLSSTQDVGGDGHIGFHKKPMGPIALGQTTGDLYSSVGVTQLSSNTTKSSLPFSDTFGYSFSMAGMDRAAQFNVNQHIRVTVNANGDLRAEVTRIRVACR